MPARIIIDFVPAEERDNAGYRDNAGFVMSKEDEEELLLPSN
jgi:hypothetical protein